jgi:peptidoglycan hydrolase-like protein with peptidoglycan-binding domain
MPEGVQKGKLTVYPCGKEYPPLEWELDVKTQSETDQRQGIQSRLKNLGFYAGKIDGEFGPVSQAALRRFHEAIQKESTSKVLEHGLSSLDRRHDI